MLSMNRFTLQLRRSAAGVTVTSLSSSRSSSRIWGATSALATSSITRAADEPEKIGGSQPAEVEGPIAKRLHFIGDTLNQVKDAATKTIKETTGQATDESEERLFESRDEIRKEIDKGKQQGVTTRDVMDKN
ncbi:hypothetical protein MVLG_00237 [Microbotryum lychnidis-dioicae p1A1 Lamole]|uniref:Uncharacterized protein n=1 Tax=Microbotryum lychnidis-dioicae (strain p1A1 Lamole / MvSl-1064) TaxID=683840 RepID=U5GYH0_USTV1|nr:hypothetical protein MVLG_00237 [Microbotryum lychnidis-dioicae p1A1 Lamole]|eukprot:KDE09839.1 hypothetical protein MVLG_00237 [Microbotryum lychnidis-dioicae p1A1 Lamole]